MNTPSRMAAVLKRSREWFTYAWAKLGSESRETIGGIADGKNLTFVVAVAFISSSVIFALANHLLLYGVLSVTPRGAPGVEHEGVGKITIVSRDDGKTVLAGKGDLPCLDYVPHRRYEVRRGEGLVLTVEVGSSPSTLAVYLSAVDRRKTGRAARWWLAESMAETNQVFRVTRALWMTYPEYPTNALSFSTWVREYWRDDLREADADAAASESMRLSERELRFHIAGPLEQSIERDYGHLSTAFPIVVVRILNGLLQWATVGCFIAAVIALACRWLVFVRMGENDVSAMANCAGGVAEISEALQRQWVGRRTGWAVDSYILYIASSVFFAAEKRGDPVAVLNEQSDAADRSMDVARQFIATMISVLPALGFVGTVVGLSATMMKANAVLSDALARQQSRMTGVALELAFAFDTTYLALILSIPASFLSSWVFAEERRVALRAQREIYERLLRLRKEGHRENAAIPVQETLRQEVRPSRAVGAPSTSEASAVADGLPLIAKSDVTVRDRALFTWGFVFWTVVGALLVVASLVYGPQMARSVIDSSGLNAGS